MARGNRPHPYQPHTQQPCAPSVPVLFKESASTRADPLLSAGASMARRATAGLSAPKTAAGLAIAKPTSQQPAERLHYRSGKTSATARGGPPAPCNQVVEPTDKRPLDTRICSGLSVGAVRVAVASSRAPRGTSGGRTTRPSSGGVSENGGERCCQAGERAVGPVRE